jgi:hypothetical protein
MVALAYRQSNFELVLDSGFWLLPLRRMARMPGLSPLEGAAAFAFSLIVAWGLAALSFRRAGRSTLGCLFATISIVPFFQIAAVALVAVVPVRPKVPNDDLTLGVNVAHILQGALAGSGIIVFAVLISAVAFGTYGWGLFLMTPFLVGVSTGYIANRKVVLGFGRTMTLVLAASSLGMMALFLFALEGLVCLVLAAPLGAIVALLGGSIGYNLATEGRQGRPLMSVALLPLAFGLEAALPSAIVIDMQETIDIAAPPSVVWGAIISSDPIGSRPFLLATAGFAYPIRGYLLGEGVGAERVGEFSTGITRERIAEWVPSQRLTVDVISQPPMMDEMSPYPKVHAPHVSGYFETTKTSFDLQPLADGRTRLTIADAHILRLDPALYWEPMARWAIRQNVTRVLRSIRDRSEMSGHKD